MEALSVAICNLPWLLKVEHPHRDGCAVRSYLKRGSLMLRKYCINRWFYLETRDHITACLIPSFYTAKLLLFLRLFVQIIPSCFLMFYSKTNSFRSQKYLLSKYFRFTVLVCVSCKRSISLCRRKPQIYCRAARSEKLD